MNPIKTNDDLTSVINDLCHYLKVGGRNTPMLMRFDALLRSFIQEFQLNGDSHSYAELPKIVLTEAMPKDQIAIKQGGRLIGTFNINEMGSTGNTHYDNEVSTIKTPTLSDMNTFVVSMERQIETITGTENTPYNFPDTYDYLTNQMRKELADGYVGVIRDGQIIAKKIKEAGGVILCQSAQHKTEERGYVLACSNPAKWVSKLEINSHLELEPFYVCEVLSWQRKLYSANDWYSSDDFEKIK